LQTLILKTIKLLIIIANNNITNIGKSIGVKVSPILFAKVSVSVAAILLTYSIGIVIGNTFNKYR